MSSTRKLALSRQCCWRWYPEAPDRALPYVARQGTFWIGRGGTHARRLLSLAGPVRPLAMRRPPESPGGCSGSSVILPHLGLCRFLLVILVHHDLAQRRVFSVAGVDLASSPLIFADQLAVPGPGLFEAGLLSSASSRYPGSSVSTYSRVASPISPARVFISEAARPSSPPASADSSSDSRTARMLPIT